MKSQPNIVGDILLVDDNPGDVRLIRETLKEASVDPAVHAVSDGPDALGYLRRCAEPDGPPQPDAILLDLHLAEMDGDEVLAELGADVSDVPVIAISGSETGAALKLDDVEDEVDACLVKPIEPEDLEDALLSG